jgi:hypothetical protein
MLSHQKLFGNHHWKHFEFFGNHCLVWVVCDIAGPCPRKTMWHLLMDIASLFHLRELSGMSPWGQTQASSLPSPHAHRWGEHNFSCLLGNHPLHKVLLCVISFPFPQLLPWALPGICQLARQVAPGTTVIYVWWASCPYARLWEHCSIQPAPV